MRGTGGFLLIALLLAACDATGVVSAQGGPSSNTAETCSQLPTPTDTYTAFGGCTPTPANTAIGEPRTPVCQAGVWTLACHKNQDCPGGSACDGTLCRVLCDTATSAGCELCGFGCVDGLCIPQ